MADHDPIPTLTDGPEAAATTVILAHGAGAPMDSPFMHTVAAGLAAAGFRVVRFEFPYMHARRAGQRKPPDREPTLRQTWHRVIGQVRAEQAAEQAEVGGKRLVIGGKSLGGRIASYVADEARVDGLICMGYPFHPPGEPAKLRTGHLATLKTPTLILQGVRDDFGTPVQVAGYDLAATIRVVWLEDGDHSWKPRKASGRTEAGNLADGIAEMVEFLNTRSR